MSIHSAYEVAAMVAESHGATETAAWLRNQRGLVADLFDAAREAHVALQNARPVADHYQEARDRHSAAIAHAKIAIDNVASEV